MKIAALALLAGGILGFAAGAGAMLIAFPFLFPPAPVDETVSGRAALMPLGEGRFREDSPGQDGAHWGRGGIRLYLDGEQVLIELQPDFVVGPGPNFWLYLNSRHNIEDEADFQADEGRVRLSKIKSFTGSQVYRANVRQMAAAASLTVWCDSFDEYIASANLPDLSAVLPGAPPQ